mmetsp:Transcript_13880/g.18128  ORF Transcript_13880/g.18128 Transcript_13880/m.18128 type:complete len:222 (+) Transcript_13880:77-742(+)
MKSVQAIRAIQTPPPPVPVVIICPGNGCNNIRESNWYGQLYNILKERNIPCICEDFPDPLHARRDRWIPFVRSLAEKNTLSSTGGTSNQHQPENVILVGHSSGAQAALRYAELYPFHACVLVSATYSDLGDAHERASGYYPQPSSNKNKNGETNPYLFEAMTSNCKIWHQFHSNNDPFIPLHEAEKIRDGLGQFNTYHMLPGRSHFFELSPELIDVVVSLC